MTETLERIAAIRCKIMAEAADSLATVLRDLKTQDATQHAREADGAAKIARGWARELMKVHTRKQKEPQP